MRDLTLTDFLGDWTLLREITHADGTTGRFEGVASWTADEGGALYLEKGALIMPQGRFAAERSYRWGDDLSVYFEDGRFFHSVPAGGGETGHWCDPDQYDVTYMFTDWPAWSCRWQVRGPRKNYMMTSRYLRA
ncbi:DUF6314 family protein [Tropicibacter naphthalenivorans]|uniref:DUF6314 domain-containing protein n=1 Tax=Tropicibacter naphthalenivorans TaxID=441103 RepID=A0A0P1G4G4_9RHOB|nr:DUF6314 family protein [Tropicibacter naphthalenivorans]CUH76709.1 hypothetical protein TRN7648_01088 [Tropicibacter naphthalenivorans]SMC63553.1 hypothetical protein SAMN04488093_102530 [Tropicibacter naphthalenivorans]